MHLHRRASIYIAALYVWALLREFRWTLLALAMAISIGAALYEIRPDPDAHRRPTVDIAIYGAWMAMLAQPMNSPPPFWYLTLMCAIYPLLGAILIGEGVVRLA